MRYYHKLKPDQYSKFKEDGIYCISGYDAKKLESIMVTLGDVTIRIEGDLRRDLENALSLILHDDFVEDCMEENEDDNEKED